MFVVNFEQVLLLLLFLTPIQVDPPLGGPASTKETPGLEAKGPRVGD